ncbi:hypothetical protein [Clostridium thermarum]|uniref:hypothetical protein n=1 Tax=Clostridium thermarum TaxID=1716543 RepID=UPI0013D10BF1|nr:hypothetical protein [Clostridium thermarum]
MVSGMGGFEKVAGVNYRVTVEVDKENEEEARQILRDASGDLKIPHKQLWQGVMRIFLWS